MNNDNAFDVAGDALATALQSADYADAVAFSVWETLNGALNGERTPLAVLDALRVETPTERQLVRGVRWLLSAEDRWGRSKAARLARARACAVRASESLQVRA